MGVDAPSEASSSSMQAPQERQARSSRCCSRKIVPELQEARPARRATTAGSAGKFTEMGVIQFEDWADTGEEYEMFATRRG